MGQHTPDRAPDRRDESDKDRALGARVDVLVEQFTELKRLLLQHIETHHPDFDLTDRERDLLEAAR